MSDQPRLPKSALRAAIWTRRGMVAERVTRAFWPLWTVLFATAACLMMGLQDALPAEGIWAFGALALGAGVWALVFGVRHYQSPTGQEALDRLDSTLRGKPIAALLDEQAIGAGDTASEGVWQAHLERMADKVSAAKAPQPDLRISDRDPYGLRFVAVIGLAVAVLFGSVSRIASVTDATIGNPALAAGPTWEGWVEPPAYTGKPTLYLNDINGEAFRAPQGSRITLRLYGEVGALDVAETVSGRPILADDDAPVEPVQTFDLTKSGTLAIEGQGGRSWSVVVEPDQPPSVIVSAPLESEADGTMRQLFMARDDYGVVSGTGTITLDLTAVERRHGLIAAPEDRAPLVVDLPMTITGDRTQFEEVLQDNFSEYAYANLPVILQLEVQDDLGQTAQSAAVKMILPGRRFFDPMAAAIIEQRRDLLWNRENGPRVAQILRAVSYLPDDIFRSETAYLRLRFILRRIEALAPYGMTDEQVEEVSTAMWDLALLLEEGDLEDARERLRRAQERLSEAMRNGASDEEIAELMQELRDASRDYIRQLAQEQQRNGEDQQQAQNGQSQELSADQLQQMMDEIQRLMEEGRMAEAQELMEQLNQMMENMRVTQGQQGGEGEQAMEGLAETLRDQQGLSDQAFRDLQEQFNPDAQAGENQGNEGRNGAQGQGESHEGQQGQGQGNNSQGQQGGQGQQPGQQQGQQQGEGGQDGEGGLEGDLADRQQALRQELNQQRGNLPGAGTEAGDAARDALGRAEGAMENAEDALRGGDLAEAIDQQSRAMEALREGMRSLGEAMAEQQQQQGQGQQQNQQAGEGGDNRSRDPLGRDRGNQGNVGTGEDLLQGEDVYRRARELLDEIRRRSGEGERPEVELEYLKRLLERF
ncbi:TIGR02302 family protein [Nereida sp. MMG025]|uniref:TIGR02302 family protein n=1 Tax=Nereida sp. MMG025 TaxID=2909981 RepID=UPI001F40F351|nr:TIGR02302 family protein [Nereida sp. MMG025]MCF6444346.1 TIGR02302 family protein [Nereida sp. MMG025]